MGRDESERSFFTWLSSRVTSAQLSMFYDIFGELQSYVSSRRRQQSPIYAISDESSFKMIASMVSNEERASWSHNNAHKQRMLQAIEYLREFCNEHLQSSRHGQAITPHVTCASPSEARDAKDAIVSPELVTGGQTQNAQMTTTEHSADVIDKHQRVCTLESWLSDEAGLGGATCQAYIKALRCAESYASERGLLFRLSITDPDEAQEAVDALREDKRFPLPDMPFKQYYSAALKQFVLFVKSASATGKSVADPIARARSDSETADRNAKIIHTPSSSPMRDSSKSRYKHILSTYFRNGLTPDGIDAAALMDKYKDHYGQTAPDDEDTLVHMLPDLGIVIDGKVYPDDVLIETGLKQKIVAYIRDAFAAGIPAVYYEVIFERFREECRAIRIISDAILIDHIDSIIEGTGWETRDYYIVPNISSSKHDPQADVIALLLENGSPMSRDDICKKLDYIPGYFIEKAFQEDVIMRSAKGVFFHVDSTAITDNDIAKISHILDTAISKHGFMSASELHAELKSKCKNVIDDNDQFNELGIRNAIKYLLRDKFVLNGMIFSRPANNYSTPEVFEQFGEHHETYTLAEVQLLADQISKGIINFEKLLQNSLRISRNEFVSVRRVSFNIKETDAAIAKVCKGQYLPLKAFTNDIFITLFPYVGYAWNIFLLESYLYWHSKEFCLFNNNFARDGCYGAVVRKDYDDYLSLDGFFANVIADSKIELMKNEALSYLCDEGYIASRRYDSIEICINLARQIRNQRSSIIRSGAN